MDYYLDNRVSLKVKIEPKDLKLSMLSKTKNISEFLQKFNKKYCSSKSQYSYFLYFITLTDTDSHIIKK